MHRTFLSLLLAAMIAATAYGVGNSLPIRPGNPDPNHTHADFAVWIDGAPLDFSAEKYMSGSSAVETDDGHDHEHLHPSFHLHDGNGNIMHRHKPGLTLGDFFNSLPGVTFEESGLSSRFGIDGRASNVALTVNGKAEPSGSAYVFADGDRLLITDAADAAQQQREWRSLTSDACLYSRICPWRGSPPAESCVADPEIPCRE